MPGRFEWDPCHPITKNVSSHVITEFGGIHESFEACCVNAGRHLANSAQVWSVWTERHADGMNNTVFKRCGHATFCMMDGHCVTGAYPPRHGLSMRACSESNILGVTVEVADAASINPAPICEYSDWTRFDDADRMLLVAREAAPEPVLPPSRCHSSGNT